MTQYFGKPSNIIRYSFSKCPDTDIRDSDLCGISQYCRNCSADRNREVRAATEWLIETGQLDPSFGN